MGSSISVVLGILLFTSVILLIHWFIHRSQTIEYSRESGSIWGYGGFEDFIREYSKCEWSRDRLWPESHFGEGDTHFQNYIHAGIICFDGKGMVLDPISYVLFLYWVYKNTYECRRYPPIVKETWDRQNEGIKIMWFYPLVDSDSWCGEFNTKKRRQKFLKLKGVK